MGRFSIEGFKGEIDKSGGVAKPNRFFVSFTPPVMMNDLQFGNKIEYFCQSVNVPGIQLNVSENRRYTYGPVEKRPYSASFTPLQLSIIADGSGSIWKFFRTWTDRIIPTMASRGMAGTFSDPLGSHSPYELRYKKDYAVDIAIYHLAETYDDQNDDRIITRTVCFEAFPSIVLDQQMNWADNNSVSQFGVQIEYTDATIEKISGEGGAYTSDISSSIASSGSF